MQQSNGKPVMTNVPAAALPVVVVGAGPVGLAAAAHLLERGLDPLVIEAALATRPSTATASISPLATSGGCRNRRHASSSTQPATPNSSTALTTAARISTR